MVKTYINLDAIAEAHLVLLKYNRDFHESCPIQAGIREFLPHPDLQVRHARFLAPAIADQSCEYLQYDLTHRYSVFLRPQQVYAKHPVAESKKKIAFL